MKKRAFTLIELLVVISIIALLLGILLPALGAARETARNAKCLSNQRQIAVAMLAYGSDTEYLPPAKADEALDYIDRSGTWFTFLATDGYLGESGTTDPLSAGHITTLLCPEADQQGQPFGAWHIPTSQKDPDSLGFLYYYVNGVDYQCSYAANAPPDWSTSLGGWPPGNFRAMATYHTAAVGNNKPLPTKVDLFEDTSQVVLAGDGGWTFFYDAYVIQLRHAGQTAANFCFADGHAASIDELSVTPVSGNFGSRDFMNQVDASYDASAYTLKWVCRNVPKKQQTNPF